MSNGFSPPSLSILSRRESTVFWICGRIALMCSCEKKGSTMLLENANQIIISSGIMSMNFFSPLLHVLWGIHVDKGCLVLRCFLSTSAHLGETGTSTVLQIGSVRIDSSMRRESTRSGASSGNGTLDRRSSVKTLHASWCLTTSQG